MANYALINNGKVENMIVADADFIQGIQNDYTSIVPIDNVSPRPCIGWDYAGGQFVGPQPYIEPELTTDQKWAKLRAQRNSRLSTCDWTQMQDAPLSSDQKATWVVYRQSLRDLPEHTQDPANPVWPTKPI